jgi:hypothetical protein
LQPIVGIAFTVQPLRRTSKTTIQAACDDLIVYYDVKFSLSFLFILFYNERSVNYSLFVINYQPMKDSLAKQLGIPEHITLEDLTNQHFAFVAENDRLAAENKIRAAENEKRAAKSEEGLTTLEAALNHYITASDQRAAAAEKRWAAVEKQLKITAKQLGDLHRKFGRMEERYMVPSVFKLLNSVGYDFREGATCCNFAVSGTDGKSQTEIDAVFDNTVVTALLEVKTSVVKIEDIEHHIRRLQIYRDFCKRKGYPIKDLIGVFAGVEFADEAKQAAIDAGFFVVVPAGKRVKFDNPEGFKAKLY